MKMNNRFAKILSTQLLLVMLKQQEAFCFTMTNSIFRRNPTRLYYEPGNDPPNNYDSSSTDTSNVWSVLANTERWISDTLANTLNAAAPGQPRGSNPYSRKEVSYVCEVASDSFLAVASIFRHVKEARELGESHGRIEESVVVDKGPEYNPGTLRKTQVIVIPWCNEFESFHTFNDVVQSINEARRNARDLVTDLYLEKKERERNSKVKKMERDWSISINVAHLHPKFGEKTQEMLLKEMEGENEDGIIDLNLQEYIDRKNRARQSPYPTAVLEVRATPPPDFSGMDSKMGGSAPSFDNKKEEKTDNEAAAVSKEYLEKLESLFGQTAAMNHPVASGNRKKEDQFYDEIGSVLGIEEVLPANPVILAENWIRASDPLFDPKTSIVTNSNLQHVDEAYEFIFTNLAMQVHNMSNEQNETDNYYKEGRQYIILPNFVSSSATSFEKFAYQINKIISSLGDINHSVTLTTYHPEHILAERRSPVPVLVLNRTI